MSIRENSRRRRFKLRTILLVVNVILFVLPLGALVFFRIYENELVKQTELELIAQAAFVSALYKAEIGAVLDAKKTAEPYGLKTALPWPAGEPYRPVLPQLTLSSHKILPRPTGGAESDEQPDGVATAAAKRLVPVLADAQRTTLAGIRLLDFRGVAVLGGTDAGLSFAHLDEVRQALDGRYSAVLRARVLNHPVPALASISRGTGIRVFAAYPIFRNDRLIGAVLLSRSPRSILQDLYLERDVVAIATAALIVLAVALAGFTSYTIARPIHALIRQAKGIASGDRAAMEPLKAPITQELALLSQSFSEMARSLEHRSEYIRDFATRVSHEFKTPLAAIRGAIELLQEHIADMPPEKRDRFMRNIADDANRLQRLVDRLLEVARADVLEPAAGSTDLAGLFLRLSERYKDFALTVHAAGAGDGAMARIAPEIAETVFANLLDNSRQNGADRVDISTHREHGVWSVAVADNGRGVSAANVESIFSPFFTTHRDEGGTGLGLGIVQSLLKAYNGDLTFRPSERGAVFIVSIPESLS